MKRPLKQYRIGYAMLAATCLASCDKLPTSLDEAKKAVTGATDQAQQSVANVTETAKQVTGAAGSIEINLDPPLLAQGCYASVYAGSSTRPAVLQITSYNDPSGESFPSIFARAEVKSSSPSDLTGQKFSARLYIQTAADGPVWQSTDDQPVELTVMQVDGTNITADIKGMLLNCETGESKPISGAFKGSFKQPAG
jgi:hypothetical protein